MSDELDPYLIEPFENLIVTELRPLFGSPFYMPGYYKPKFREMLFGKKDACTCDPDRWIFPDHFNDCPLDKD